MKNLNNNQSASVLDESTAIDFPDLGMEFENIENVSGTPDELSTVFHNRLKRHIINSRNAIASNPASVNSIYNAKALGDAYNELIDVWDHEPSREQTLEKLSASEEKMLVPSLQGLGDLVHGTDDELLGVIGTSLNDLSGLGKKDHVRKHVTGSTTKTKKSGVFTKIKKASQHVKEEARQKGANVKKAVKKVGHAVVKFNPVTIAVRAGFLVAMKANAGKIASRVYWGHFTLDQARRSGVTPEYWSAAHKGWERLKNTFVNKLKGDETTLFRAVSQGRAKHTKGRVNGVSGLGLVDPQTIMLVLKLLKPILDALNKSFQGKQETLESEPETEEELNYEPVDDSTDDVNGLGFLLV